jgi:transcriptional regulator with XRE-family HTH domain
MKFHKQIQLIRKRHGLTMKALAERIGVSEATISLWESGKIIPEKTRRKHIDRIFGADETLGLTVAESPAPYHLAGSGKMVTDQEQEYTGKLLVILRRKDEGTKQAIMQNIDQFLRVPDAVIPRKKRALE